MRISRSQRMLGVSAGVLLWVLCSAVQPLAGQSAGDRGRLSSGQGPSAQGPEQTTPYVPQYSSPQYRPCPRQPRSFKALSKAFSTGRLPAASELQGSWVLTGLWLYPNSRPDLNCSGIRRGDVFEWVLRAGSDNTVVVDAVGTYHQTVRFGPSDQRSLSLEIDFAGDSNPTFQCRMTQQGTLICLGDTYYSGTEFRRMPVNCKPVDPKSAAIDSPILCMPPK